MRRVLIIAMALIVAVLLGITVALLRPKEFSQSGAKEAAAAQASGDARYYEIGAPVLTDIWVDPASGSDNNNGSSRSTALRTITAAWNRIPSRLTPGTTGYRIMLAAGSYQPASAPNYWESRHGTYRFPIIIQAADGAGTVSLPGMNVFDCRYLYLIGLKLEASGGDVLHFEKCDHVLIRQTTIIGTGNIAAHESPQEVLKANQCQYVYIEDSDISGGWDNAVDFVAVQYGHIVGTKIHRAHDWCIYVKGGSAYIRIEANEIFDGGTGGFTAGQGTGFQWMASPWLHYEAYDIKFINNIIHDTDGAGMGAQGGYNILLAYNTLYRVGRSSHVLGMDFGARSCDGRPGNAERGHCDEYLALNGWGTTVVDDGDNFVRIPNKNVFVYNNIIYNPRGYQSQWQHFFIAAPYSGPWQSGSNAPRTALADDGLQIRGNLIWNGPSDHPLGVEDSNAGCRPGNPTCNEARLRAENSINTVEPQLANHASGDFHPAPGGNVFNAQSFAVPDFTWNDAPAQPLVPASNISNAVTRDCDGKPRASISPPGAYAGSDTMPAGPRITGASVEGKKLLVTGESFASGSVILLNRTEQKTINDARNPTTTLIGKKAGKKIARGEMATLQVRTPDGKLSNEFKFTRPAQ